MNFEFATATRIIFGPGKRTELFAAARAIGGRALLVTGSHPERAAWAAKKLECETFPVNGEPSIGLVEEGARRARESQASLVVAIGGGSVIDAGKAIAALATNSGHALDYLEVIGSAKPLRADPLPFIALPTTAGTGSEVTRNAVLSAPEHKLKVSLRSPKMLPALAVVDPELTYDLPSDWTASTGMDALTQLIEPFLSSRANPLVDALCREMIPRCAQALPKARDRDQNARVEMSLASLMGGLALANAGLGAVHGLAAPLGGMFPAPHGAVCAALLPHVVAVNLEAVRNRAPGSSILPRFTELARLLTGNPGASPLDAVDHLHRLQEELGVPGLNVYGVTEAAFPELAARAMQASSMKANPIELTAAEVGLILSAATT